MRKGRMLFILGASSDIGLALISKVDPETIVVAHCNNSCDLLNKMAASNKNINIVKANLKSDSEVLDMLNAIESLYGIPEQIVHLAAPKMNYIRFKDLEWTDFQNEFDIQFKSIFLVLNRFLPNLAKEKINSSVVCMLSSVTFGVPPSALSHYTSAKFALLGLMKSLACEYASKNIRLNCVSPSMVDTKFLENLNEKIVEINASANPLKRNASSAEVANTIQFLLSDNSSYINGSNIILSGGSIF